MASGFIFRIFSTAALLALSCGAALAQSYVAGPGLALAITDDAYNGTQGSMTCNTIAVPSDGNNTVSAATVRIAMSHTWVGDLTIKLISPAGTVITLVSRPGTVEVIDNGTSNTGAGENSNLAIANPLLYDDAAPNPSEQMGKIPSDLANGDVICAFAGSPCTYAPSFGAAVAGNLGNLGGESKVGNWQLCIGDSGSQDLGVLDGWTLTLVSTPVSLQSFSID